MDIYASKQQFQALTTHFEEFVEVLKDLFQYHPTPRLSQPQKQIRKHMSYELGKLVKQFGKGQVANPTVYWDDTLDDLQQGRMKPRP
ncbi:hypothetical protein SUGI_0144670 [Cryptomeria japonica]|nr:hypothetical protein SUGI_0144670 [Cryptomeria japonica]